MEKVRLSRLVMPIRNEAAFIKRSLGAVLAQDYPRERMEVLIAMVMSTDGLEMSLLVWPRLTRISLVTVLDNPGEIVPTGMNAALARAQGEIIVRVDGHTIIAPDYVRECVLALERSGACNVGGRMDAVSESRFVRRRHCRLSSRFGVEARACHYSDREEWVEYCLHGRLAARRFPSCWILRRGVCANQETNSIPSLIAHAGDTSQSAIQHDGNVSRPGAHVNSIDPLFTIRIVEARASHSKA